MSPQALNGMMVGAVIMFLFGVVWLLLGVYTGRPLPGWLRMCLLLAGVLLAVWIGITIHGVRRVSERAAAATTRQVVAGREIGRRFGWITAIEGVAIFLAVVILNVTRRPDLILPVIALIVGLHFFPLASLFGTPIYYGTATLGCAIGVAGFFISDPRLRISVVGLSFGVLLWITTAALLVEVVPI